MAEILIRLPQVLSRTGFRRASLYRAIQAGRFPKPIKPTQRTAAWVASQVDEWIDSKIRASEGR
jgi:prophage regulatory protein